PTSIPILEPTAFRPRAGPRACRPVAALHRSGRTGSRTRPGRRRNRGRLWRLCDRQPRSARHESESFCRIADSEETSARSGWPFSSGLDRSEGHAADQEALDQEREDDNRGDSEHTERRLRAPFEPDRLAEVGRELHRNCVVILIREDQCEEELVPAEDKG